ncbi:MAG: alpha/beta fold hydrolase [Chloroflexota bacterium]
MKNLKNLAKIIGVVIVLLIVIYALGPRITIETTVTQPNIPEDVDSYIQGEEAQFPDIKPDAEKIVIWADPATKADTDIALVYIPGFGVSRPETAPVSDLVADELQANLYYTRMTGHGRTSDAFAQATANDWINDVLEAVEIGRTLGDQVVLVGSSTGATIILWLASEGHLDDVDALILLSPNLAPNEAGIELLLGPWGEQIGQVVIDPIIQWRPSNEAQAIYWNTTYHDESIFQMLGLVRLARNADTDRIQSPVLVFYSPDDTVANPARMIDFYEGLSVTPKKLIAVPDTQDPDKHVVAGDILSPQTTNEVVEEMLLFLEGVLE